MRLYWRSGRHEHSAWLAAVLPWGSVLEPLALPFTGWGFLSSPEDTFLEGEEGGGERKVPVRERPIGCPHVPAWGGTRNSQGMLLQIEGNPAER